MYEPSHFGCRGGGDGGGLGGGIVNITVLNNLKIDGLISADGENARKLHAGGGSGGSIWITTNVIQGYGDVTVNGGHGFVDVRYVYDVNFLALIVHRSLLCIIHFSSMKVNVLSSQKEYDA